MPLPHPAHMPHCCTGDSSLKCFQPHRHCQGLIFFPDLLQRRREANISPVPSGHILGAWKCHLSCWSRCQGNSIQWDPLETHFIGDGGRKEEKKGQTFTRGRTLSCNSLTSVILQRPFSRTKIKSQCKLLREWWILFSTFLSFTVPNNNLHDVWSTFHLKNVELILVIFL